ncbi:50S ribosomal protein L1 [candidate division KSB3 bacterium]|uniref:Large ribosomal subunit protein uL1 n=1 Tax=candidate division KSB3 bacterium TaxID=2044937 RepID=A0A2G6E0M5_9BACT|nr:MAG: 50S ribosomal protein L1 [candidate division KSB3 bacterium]PIE31056.1 MAG: 50S ribosomal protein L1 [candidate division KSB3 bacterium]
MAKKGKKYLEAVKKIDAEKKYTLEEGLALLKEVSYANFDETIDIAVRLGVDPRKADQMVRGSVGLPHGTGKTVRVLVFAKGEKEQEAQEAGADFVGSDDLAEKIQGGWLDFDRAIATPDMMGTVGKLGRILGPRGLMPNPKTGTVTFEVAQAVKDVKAGQVEFRVEKAGIIHCPIGKRSFSEDQLVGNAKALLQQLVRMKPSTSKGQYIRSVAVSSTMGIGIKLDPVAVAAGVR